jgi:hypothetical protein
VRSKFSYIKPVWGASLEELKNGYVDIYQDYDQFLELVARWIGEQAASSPRGGLVCQAMREANHVWFGVGVYTICEILFMAGQLNLSFFIAFY